MTAFKCGRFSLDLSQTKIMGVLNCTPDSFSDGGRFLSLDAALAQAEKLLRDGADILDLGAESTRPGAAEVPAEEEIRRLRPLVQELRRWSVPLSIDTKKTAVMAALLDEGADMINDVRALEDEGALDLVKRFDCGLCLMHMRGQPATMQANTDYGDLIGEVRDYLGRRVAAAEAVGIDRARLCLDFGFGFGKTPAQNMALIRHSADFLALGLPLLVGVSRKSTIGHYLGGAPVAERLIGSVTLAALSAWLGAGIVRVHDVAETRQALAMVAALKNAD